MGLACFDYGRGGYVMPVNPTLLWVIAVILAVIGVILLINGSVIAGIVLLVLAALVGPGGYSIFNRRGSV
jgi:drug/metabolite transporter (DMT)-like permease